MLDELEETRQTLLSVGGLPFQFGCAIVHGSGLTAGTGGKVAFLLNLTSLCHSRRNPWFRVNRPARIWAIDDIVCWPHERHGYGKAPRYFSKHRYCWVVWDHAHRGGTSFDWLSSSDYR